MSELFTCICGKKFYKLASFGTARRLCHKKRLILTHKHLDEFVYYCSITCALRCTYCHNKHIIYFECCDLTCEEKNICQECVSILRKKSIRVENECSNEWSNEMYLFCFQCEIKYQQKRDQIVDEIFSQTLIIDLVKIVISYLGTIDLNETDKTV